MPRVSKTNHALHAQSLWNIPARGLTLMTAHRESWALKLSIPVHTSSRTTSKDHPLVTGENAAAELFLICSSGKAANVPKPASVGIASSQIRIAFGVRMFDEMRNFCLLQKFLPVGSSFFLRTA
jgi:hypothetical protein